MRIAFDHIAILTPEIDESVHFYTDFMEMQVRSRKPSAATSEIICLEDGSRASKMRLYLIGPPFSSWMDTFVSRHGPMLAFLGFEVDDVDSWYQLLQTDQTELLTPIEELDEGMCFYLHDPAGIILKMIQHAPSSTPTETVKTNADTSTYKLSHTNITCSEFNTLETFYVNVLGMKIVLDRRDEGLIFLADQVALSDEDHDIFPLELFGPPALWDADLAFLEKHGAGLQYLCFAVEDVDKAYQSLRSKGANFHLPPTDFGENRVAFFKDPNGIDIEILHPLPQDILRGSANAKS
jgi:catechol 2,3-dioxygenase-like lactoylglutathione lyase family enzyme